MITFIFIAMFNTASTVWYCPHQSESLYFSTGGVFENDTTGFWESMSIPHKQTYPTASYHFQGKQEQAFHSCPLQILKMLYIFKWLILFFFLFFLFGFFVFLKIHFLPQKVLKLFYTSTINIYKDSLLSLMVSFY